MGVIDRIFRRQIEKRAEEKAPALAAGIAEKKVDQILSANIARLKDKYGVGMTFGPGGYPTGNPFGGLYNNQVGGAKYQGGLSDSGASQLYSHYDMRQNARTAYHDTVQARSIVDRFADVVVDSGLVAESAIDFETLGIDAETAEIIGRQIDLAFDAWSRNKKQHRARNMTFYQAQRLYQIMQQRDNDNFVRLFYSGDRRLLNPLQFDFIDANQIRGYGWTTTYGPFFQEDGIKRDADGVELSYKVWIQNQEDGGIKDVDIPAMDEATGRLFMLHGFCPEYPGQLRGYSRLGHALQELQNITDFSLAEIKKAINQSNLVLAVENQQKDPSNPLAQLISGAGQGGVGPSIAAAGLNADSLNITNEELTGRNWSYVPQGLLEQPGSLVVADMEQGDTMKLLGNTSPVQSFDAFVTSVVSSLCASFSMAPEVVMLKFSSNYSASRAALILAWRTAVIWRIEMASDFLDPVREMFIAEEIAAGRLSLPGWSDPRLRAAWLNCQWNGAPMPQIDPTKEAAANKMNAELGATTLDRVSRDLNGSSGATNRQKLRREYADLPTPPWNEVGRAPVREAVPTTDDAKKDEEADQAEDAEEADEVETDD